MALITYVTRIHFADRVLEDALGEEMGRHGIRRPLLVSDAETAASDAYDRVVDALPVPAEPVRFVIGKRGPEAADADLEEASRSLTDARFDGIVGVGGLRPLDLARMLGGTGIPVLAVPTGAESVGLGPLGADVACSASRPPAIPAAILCDPTLTLEAGPAATAAAGMDALVHCLESFLSTTYNPPADGIALDGVRRAALNIEAAVSDGRNLAARRELLAAALDAGLASQKGFGGIEAAAHGLEAHARVRHGSLHGALMGAVLAFNAPAVSDRFAALCRALALPADADLTATLSGLARRLDLPAHLSDAGIAADALPAAARLAAADPASRTNPRHATTRDYERIMAAAL